MAPRRSARPTVPIANPKAVGKTKVTKPTTKKSIQKPTVTKKKRTTTTTTAAAAAKTFPCGCANPACNFSLHHHNLRLVLGRPEFNEDTSVQCACKVHYHCANRWATAHTELPAVLPCGCGITKRGADFWLAAIASRRVEMKEKKQEEEKKKIKMDMQKKKLEMWGEDFDSGSDLTDLED
jgi:hypothetical protein